MDTVDCVVVGAGVVGLACARALAREGREVLVLEQEALIGSHTSSRNSEVIHAGIYYPEGLAPRRGSACAATTCSTPGAPSRGVPHRAPRQDHRRDRAEQAGALAAIAAAARGNGVEDPAAARAPDLAGSSRASAASPGCCRP